MNQVNFQGMAAQPNQGSEGSCVQKTVWRFESASASGEEDSSQSDPEEEPGVPGQDRQVIRGIVFPGPKTQPRKSQAGKSPGA